MIEQNFCHFKIKIIPHFRKTILVKTKKSTEGKLKWTITHSSFLNPFKIAQDKKCNTVLRMEDLLL